jgi:hypothetical protein
MGLPYRPRRWLIGLEIDDFKPLGGNRHQIGVPDKQPPTLPRTAYRIFELKVGAEPAEQTVLAERVERSRHVSRRLIRVFLKAGAHRGEAYRDGGGHGRITHHRANGAMHRIAELASVTADPLVAGRYTFRTLIVR